ncbi:unnamed protein product [Euphydryas editha]|uniref:Reverse transcriptase domain-containing protein n=1 Tax=Euphydryas editha TaxID=104508 RepID=A0AAU9UHW0_EUPED|nr:unnamed protein product [Euphydryas editha]
MSEGAIQDNEPEDINIIMEDMEEEDYTQSNTNLIYNDENLHNADEGDGNIEGDWTLSGADKRRKIEKFDLCITSSEKLPKQFALAKFFDKEKIVGINYVKYINAFKVLVRFGNLRDAEKLMGCHNIKENGWKVYKTWEVQSSYGVIRDIDLDLSGEDILESIKSSNGCKILSVKRLSRRNSLEPGWLPSETVRLCFLGSSRPEYITIHNLRVRVEPFVFPVTQCSRCWRFGHVVKFCPSIKVICPKCGKNHPNCETTTFKCVNCQENHMSLAKFCPVYVKEKKIRSLMSEFNCTYRRALTMYVPPFSPRSNPFPTSYNENKEINRNIYTNILENKNKTNEDNERNNKKKKCSSSEQITSESDSSISSKPNASPVADKEASTLNSARSRTDTEGWPSLRPRRHRPKPSDTELYLNTRESHNVNTIEEEVNKQTDYVPRSSSNSMRDFNAHHFTWSYTTNARGSQIYDSISEYNLLSLNDGSHTRVKLVGGAVQQSSPDISVVTPDIACFLNWKVTNETLGSDHLIIIISTASPYSPNFIRKRNYKSADWKSYTTYLEKSFSNFNTHGEPQLLYDSFIDNINKAADKFIPFKKNNLNPVSKFTPKPYWSPNLSHSVAKRRLALSIFRKNPTPTNLAKLNECVQTTRKLIKKASRDGWHSFCGSLDHASAVSEIWKKMKWMKGNRAQTSYLDKDKSESFLANLCPAFVVPPKPNFTSSNSKLESSILLHELESCIKSRDSAPGCDEISFSMIKNLPPIGKNILLSLYNIFLSTGFTPFQWQDIYVVPIPKAGRDITLTSSLRPISLISCICKIFHLILNRRLDWFFEKSGLFSVDNVGFRKSKSSLDSLTRLVSRVQSGFTKGLSTLACFVDIDNAYNNVNINVLLTILDNIGGGSKLCNYLWNFLTFRNLKIRHVEGFISRRTGQGLAQGDPLSPLLFNVATYNICNSIKNIFVSQYADDFALYVSEKNLDNACCLLQASLDFLINSLHNLGLSV